MLRDYNYKRETLSREIINQILHLVCLPHLTKLGEMQVPCTAVRKEKHGLCIIEEYMADPSAQCLRTVGEVTTETNCREDRGGRPDLERLGGASQGC